MTKFKIKELEKVIATDKPKWADMMYKEKDGKRVLLTELGNASWKVFYKDGSFAEDHFTNGKAQGTFKTMKYENMDKAVLYDAAGNELHSIKIKDDKLVLFLRNSIRPRDGVTFQTPKRVFVMGTVGILDFVWDDGDIDEIDHWGTHCPYNKPERVGVFALDVCNF